MAKKSFSEGLDRLLDPIVGYGGADSWKKQGQRVDDAAAQYDGVKAPTLGEYTPEDYSWLSDFDPVLTRQYSDLTPTLAATESQRDTAYGDIALDPRLRDTQMARLDDLNDIAKRGGLSLSDQADLQRIRNQVAQSDRGRRQAILANMDSRGLGGSGFELQAQLDSVQDATNRQSQESMDIAAQAQRRALQAILSGADLAGSIRNADYRQEADRASAQDAIERFNTASRNAGAVQRAETANDFARYNRGQAIERDRFNAGMQNEAGMYNNRGRQAIAGSNIDLHNQAQRFNNFDRPMQDFRNDMQIRGARAGAYEKQGDYYGKMGDRAEARRNNYMQAGGQLGSKIFSSMGSAFGGGAGGGGGGGGGGSSSTGGGNAGSGWNNNGPSESQDYIDSPPPAQQDDPNIYYYPDAPNDGRRREAIV